MAGSASEREIRDYAANRLRQILPGSRIIHELVVGGCRADLAAVERERITLVEIKSQKDVLKRLDVQMRHFERAAHSVIVIAHEKWFDRTPYNTGHPRFVPSDELEKGVKDRATIWAYPEQADRPLYGTWALPYWKLTGFQPRASEMLLLLWKSELLAEAGRHHVSCSTRSTVTHLVREMAWHMTGKEIAQAVCRQLRGRPFPEADPPIAPDIVAAASVNADTEAVLL